MKKNLIEKTIKILCTWHERQEIRDPDNHWKTQGKWKNGRSVLFCALTKWHRARKVTDPVRRAKKKNWKTQSLTLVRTTPDSDGFCYISFDT